MKFYEKNFQSHNKDTTIEAMQNSSRETYKIRNKNPNYVEFLFVAQGRPCQVLQVDEAAV